jgi:hypothetical protein
MLRLLRDFRERHGHCNVPAHYKANLSLGRWVSAQRYKKKVGDLTDEQVRQLDDLGLVWSPSDIAWQKKFRLLEQFKEQHGHCNVPERWSEDRQLANWVQSQRHRHKKGKLPAERVRKLDALGFMWGVYGRREEADAPAPSAEEPEEPVEQGPAERLYRIGNGTYVQYDGNGTKPPELVRYVAAHGDYPPFIPLPQRSTTFFLGDRCARQRPVKWPGNGPLPESVMAFVLQNGTLPRHEE